MTNWYWAVVLAIILMVGLYFITDNIGNKILEAQRISRVVIEK